MRFHSIRPLRLLSVCAAEPSPRLLHPFSVAVHAVGVLRVRWTQHAAPHVTRIETEGLADVRKREQLAFVLRLKPCALTEPRALEANLGRGGTVGRQDMDRIDQDPEHETPLALFGQRIDEP